MVCCVCLLESHNVMGIFDDLGEQLNIAETIKIHFWFKPQPNNPQMTQICSICWHKIDDFHEFYQTVEKAHKDFKEIHQKDIDIVKEEDNKPCTGIIKQEQDEDVFEDNLMQIEVEIDNNDQEDLQANPLESGQNDSDDVLENESASSENYEPSEVSEHNSEISELNSGSDEDKKPLDKKVTKKLKSKKIKKVKNPVKKRIPKRKVFIKKEKNESSDLPKKKRIFNRLDPVLTEEMILKHIPMGCNLCVFVGKTFHDIVEHFKKYHPNVRAYITCCDKKFTKRYYVAQHAMNHENPNSFRCEECNKSFTTTGGLQKHNLNYHAPEEERIFPCELCPRKFARQHLLQLHKTSHIPKELYDVFCTKCPTPKAFASEYLLNIHDNKLHKRATNICNVCAKEIKDKKAFEKHVRGHYEGSGPRVKCPFADCDSWLKDEDCLKIHLRRHNIDGTVFKCPDCDKVCPNRRALSSHKIYVHSNEVYKCEHCDKTFKKAISLREHIAQHTGEVLYNCPFCTRTFNSNANMHSHKKKQHPIEWAEARRQKLIGGPSSLINTISSIY